MITAIIPCYNAERYLGSAIESVLAQTRPADEILVVDDCSTDNSAAVARGYPVQFLQTKTNSGHAAARNLGIAAARGDLIAWLDADDYWNPNHLEVVCGLLNRHPQADVAFSAVRLFGDRNAVQTGFPCSGEPRNVFWESLRDTIVPAMSAVVRRQAVLDVGGYDESFRVAPDYDLWLRMSCRHLFVSTDEVTSNYRRHASQISRFPRKQIEAVYRSRQLLVQRLRSEGEENFAREVEQQMLKLWDQVLLSAWHLRDLNRLRFHLALRPWLPDITPTARRLARRAYLPLWTLRIWDRLGRRTAQASAA